MTHAIDVPDVLAAVSALLYIGLGIWVLRLRSRRRQTTLLGAFAILYGLLGTWSDWVLGLLHLVEFQSAVYFGVLTALSGAAYGLALALAWSVPEPLGDKGLLWKALFVGFGLLLPSTAVLVSSGFDPIYPLPYEGTLLLVATLEWLFRGLLVSAVVLMALRAHPARRSSPGEVTQLAILSVAVVAFLAFAIGLSVPIAAEALAEGWTSYVLFAGSMVLVLFAMAGLWGRNMVEAGKTTVRIHRAAFLGILGLGTASAIYAVAFGHISPAGSVTSASMRTLGVALLAYGVLRHDLAGLDEKVEFGISKTTVAGVFIAVFFIVSEGAQALFADFAGNELIGVVAAGALVFAISPLQRFADRFAAKAVPGGAESGQGAGDREDAYRKALRMALADGEISPAEEDELADRAEALGLGPKRALELRREVEDAAAGGDG